ncbi:hypothetical protein GCM10027569_32690 [Flindersiella endophytica]
MTDSGVGTERLALAEIGASKAPTIAVAASRRIGSVFLATTPDPELRIDPALPQREHLLSH